MARPKKVETNTASIVDEKNSAIEVEETASEKTETVEKPETNKVKKVDGNGKYVIKCEALAGKKLSLPTRMVEFDENGKCEVTGEEANRLLTIPGYELSK